MDINEVLDQIVSGLGASARQKAKELRKAADFFRPQAFSGRQGFFSALATAGTALSLAMLVAVAVSALGVLLGTLAAIFLILKLVLGAGIHFDPSHLA